MNKQTLIFLSFVPFLILELLAADGKAPRPNVVVIVADDLGYAEVGYRGSRDMVTPHIDSLASNGVQFSAGYVTAPVCAPTRAGLLTGVYQNRFGFEDNPGPYKLNKDVRIGIPKSVPTMPERLKALGYATGLIGKSHTGNDPEFQPNNSGFDEFFGFNNGASNYRPDGKLGKKINQPANPILRGCEQVEEPEYLTDAFGREAVAFIDRHHDNPFFLYLPFNAIHGPQQAADQDLELFTQIADKKRRQAVAMTYALDRNVGRVLAALRKHGLEENTIIFFLSDNGGKASDNGSLNTPLRGEKGQLWEGGIRVPFCMQWLARIKGGRTLDFPVIALDILPTAVAAAGGQAGEGVDGLNLTPFVTGDRSPPTRTLYWRFNRSWAVRDGEWKLLFEGGTSPQLFRIAEDMGEAHNLYGQQPDVVKRLKAAYDAWAGTLMPKQWGWDKSFPVYDPRMRGE